MTRIFVTGLGTVNPLGNSLEQTWSRLKLGDSGLSRLTLINTDDLEVKIGGEVKDFDESLAEVHPDLVARRMDRATQFAVAAAGQAIDHAGLPRPTAGQHATWGQRCGVYLGAGLAGMSTLQAQTEVLLEKGPQRVSPFTIPMLMPNAPAAAIGIGFGISGPSHVVSTACASSGHAVIAAIQAIQCGIVDMAITGGTEAAITRLGIASFTRMKAMATGFNDDPAHAIRPFSKDRLGFVMSEGAGIFLIESQASAEARGAQKLAEIISYGATSDAHHLVRPDSSATEVARCISDALRRAQLEPDQHASRIYVNAHGTGTILNDFTESKALGIVFGDHAHKLQISSTKSMTGHLIGAACAVETIASVMALREQILPPTINYTQPDPDCPWDYVPNEARLADVTYALNNSFGFGGHNVTLVLKRA